MTVVGDVHDGGGMARWSRGLTHPHEHRPPGDQKTTVADQSLPDPLDVEPGLLVRATGTPGLVGGHDAEAVRTAGMG